MSDNSDRVIRVIKSCKTIEQLNAAEIYLRLWEIRDPDNKGKLDHVLFGQKMKLNNGWGTKD